MTRSHCLELLAGLLSDWASQRSNQLRDSRQKQKQDRENEEKQHQSKEETAAEESSEIRF